MFEMRKFSGQISEVSYHERRNLAARESNPRANIVRALVLNGTTHAEKLQNAVHRLVLRHEALRTRFRKDASGSYVREVSTTADVVVEHVDFSGFKLDDAVVKTYLKDLLAKGFGPEDYPLAGVHVLTTSTKPLFIFIVAEVIADAGSSALLLRELSCSYLDELDGTPVQLPPLQYQLSDFVASHNAWMQTPDYRASVQRLRDKLHNLIETEGGVGQLIFARKSNNGYSFSGDLSSRSCEKVFRLANAMQVSPPTVLIVVSAICVARIRSMSGIFITSSFSNRHISTLTNVVGHLATTVPNFVSLRADTTGLPVKKMHRELFASMAQYGMIPMQEISDEVKRLYPDRPAGTTIKFGKIVTDVSVIDEFLLFGMDSETYPSDGARAELNEFKFVFRVLSSGKIKLQLRGLQETDNDVVAANIVEHLLEETIESL